MNIHAAAANILYRGVDLDNKKRYTEALICYQEGIQLLVDSLKGESGERRTYLRNKIEGYMKRAEEIKDTIKDLKEKGTFHEQITIHDNCKGYSYETVFGRFLDDDVDSVEIEDPYIRIFHQCQNLVRLCELLVKKCKNIKKINLLTSKDGNHEQHKWLKVLKDNLLSYNVHLNVHFSETLHDRRITLSSGWIIKIGRGLDYFKPPGDKFELGTYDLDFRPCHETTVDIFHSNNIKKS